MGNIINAENLTKSFTGRKLFSEASFYVQEGKKVGIVGINGTGKSTLLRILAGLEEPDGGTVTVANHVVFHYLPQTPVFDEEKSLLDAVMEQVMENRTDEENRWALESDAKSLLQRMELSDYEKKTGELSGGQKKRLALIVAVLCPCDVLLLDEPTNHLDYEMVEWLEDYLKKWRKTLIMVTHDRYFLDCVCNRIVEIDKGQVYSYDTNYSGFLERKAARMESAAASERKRQSVLRKEIEWMQRGARARSTKQKAHIQRYEQLRDQKAPTLDRQIEMASISERMGRTTIELEHVSKRYGEVVCVEDFSYIFLKNDRIGFVGQNGCGKTTLMKMIAGLIEPDAGTITVGQTIKIGYYSQEIQLKTTNNLINESEKLGKIENATEIAKMNPKDRVIDYIKNAAEYVRTSEGLVSASAMLERFLFPPEQQYSLIEKLSGGERRRLHLLHVLMEAPNVLIMDEPTNDLDTQTLAVLEDYLDNFAGIVVAVSHDRYFLDRIARRIFAFEGNGRIVQYEGGYTDYMNKRPKACGQENPVKADNGASEVKTGTAGSMETWKHEKKVKFSYKEQREYETIESEIEALEQLIDELEYDMQKNACDFGKLNAISQQKEQAEQELEEKMERWEYLEELAQQIRLQDG